MINREVECVTARTVDWPPLSSIWVAGMIRDKAVRRSYFQDPHFSLQGSFSFA